MSSPSNGTNGSEVVTATVTLPAPTGEQPPTRRKRRVRDETGPQLKPWTIKLKPRRKPYYAAQWRNSIGQRYRATLTIGKLNFRVVVG
jgi:hypothetical protein